MKIQLINDSKYSISLLIKIIDITKACNSQAIVSIKDYPRSGIRNNDITKASNSQARVSTQYHSRIKN